MTEKMAANTQLHFVLYVHIFRGGNKMDIKTLSFFLHISDKIDKGTVSGEFLRELLNQLLF